jgi:hypothetical protein
MFMGKLGTNIYHCKNKNPPSVFETMNRKDGAENKNKTVIGANRSAISNLGCCRVHDHFPISLDTPIVFHV